MVDMRTRSSGIFENSFRGFFSQEEGGASLGPGIQTGIASTWMSSWSSGCLLDAPFGEPLELLPAAAPLGERGRAGDVTGSV